MRRTTITCLLAIFTCTGAMAQWRLQSGAPSNLALAKLPYFYYDLMRYENNSFIRQYRTNAQQEWGNSNLFINRKDAEGRFEYLESALWDWNTGSWQIYRKFSYERKTTNNNLTFQKAESWTRDQNSQLRNYTFEEQYRYDNGVMKSGSSTISDASGVLSEVEHIFFYDNQGRRIHDSESVDFGAYALNSYYRYDGPGGKLSDHYYLFDKDSSSKSRYAYDNNGWISRFSDYYYLSDTPTLTLEEVYEHDAQGRISKATRYFGDSTGLNPAEHYEHGYNSLNRLQWMTSYNYENNKWVKSDSTYITYTGNKSDTSYGYLSANGTDWNTYPSYRFLFDESRVGLKDPVKNALSFTMYPNPAKERLTISLNENKEIRQIVITDLTGREIATYTGAHPSVDISEIKSGMYLVKVETKDAVGIKKLLIE